MASNAFTSRRGNARRPPICKKPPPPVPPTPPPILEFHITPDPATGPPYSTIPVTVWCNNDALPAGDIATLAPAAGLPLNILNPSTPNAQYAANGIDSGNTPGTYLVTYTVTWSDGASKDYSLTIIIL